MNHFLLHFISKEIKLVGLAAEIMFKSKFEPLPVILQPLPKCISEDNGRFRLQMS